MTLLKPYQEFGVPPSAMETNNKLAHPGLKWSVSQNRRGLWRSWWSYCGYPTREAAEAALEAVLASLGARGAGRK
jgi:hypothetical protein